MLRYVPLRKKDKKTSLLVFSKLLVCSKALNRPTDRSDGTDRIKGSTDPSVKSYSL